MNFYLFVIVQAINLNLWDINRIEILTQSVRSEREIFDGIIKILNS
jgi:hypothetical protein